MTPVENPPAPRTAANSPSAGSGAWRIGHILVPLDGSNTAERALVHAATLGRLFGARITLARVPEPMVIPVITGAVWVTEQIETGDAAAEATRYLDEVRGRDVLAGISVTTVSPPFPVASGLLDAIDASGADLVVMTTHGHAGFQRFVFGSVADKLVHAARVPIYLVREGEAVSHPPRFRRILLPLDGSEQGEAALPTTIGLARASGADLTLVQIPTVPSYVTGIPETAGWIPKFLGEQAEEAARYLEVVAGRLEDEGLRCEIDVEVVSAGSVSDGILASAREHAADVIVMSTHGRAGLGRWVFGSVADQVLRHAELPVWLVRAAGHP